MKTVMTLLAGTIIFTACGDNTTNSKGNTEKSNNSASTSTSVTSNENKKTGSVNEVVSSYLDLKNALTNDNGKDAAAAADAIGTNLAKVDETGLTPEQKKVYDDLKDDIKEHAEHIGSNASNIEHQREHFDLLSRDMIDLVKSTGTDKFLYSDFCPMYNNKKGAPWLSETKEIKNPYYGSKMIKCGEVKEEIKPKG